MTRNMTRLKKNVDIFGGFGILERGSTLLASTKMFFPIISENPRKSALNVGLQG